MLSRDIYFIFNVNHASNGPTSIEINNNQTYCIINSSGLGYSYSTIPKPNYWVLLELEFSSQRTSLT